jgi:hypothetical protein
MDAPERGAGLFGLSFAFAVFLTLLMLAVQVAYDLHTTSVVTGVAIDAAREVAGYDNVAARHRAAGAAERDARDRLGRLGRDMTFEWVGLGDDVVVLRVSGPTPGLLPGLVRSAGLGELDRTVSVRAEELRG